MATVSDGLKQLNLLGNDDSLSLNENTGLDDAKALLNHRWRKALQKCRDDLSPADYESIQQFDSAEALFNDLRNIKTEYSQSWQGQAGENVQSALGPATQSLESVSMVFVMTMIPYRPSLGGLWGLLHLLAKVSLSSQDIWEDFRSKTDQIQRKLEILGRCAACFPPGDETHEMSRAILSVFTSLIHFWVEAVNWNRKQRLRPFHFSSLNKKFETAIVNVEASVEHITKLLDIATKAQGGAEMLQKLDLAQENVKFPQFILPRAASQVFYGRDNIFEQLDKQLDPKTSPNNLRSALLYGIGGVGKTSTTLQYAHRKPSPYDAVFWIKSETAESLQQSFTDVATSLKLPGARADGQDEQNLLYVKNWLRTQEARQENGRKWLFIFDNCDNIDIINTAQVLTTSGSVIITSRYSHASLSDTLKIPLKPFKPDDSLEVLKRFLSEKHFSAEEERVLKDLLRKVDGLPLGIRVLAAMINARTCALTEYPAFFKKHSRKLFVKVDAPEDYHGTHDKEENVLDQVWLMSFKTLKSGPKSLLAMMSFISSEDILPSWFCLDANQVGVETEEPSVLSICEDELELHNAIGDLQKAALIEKEKSRESGTMILSVHRLIQEAFIYNCDAENRQKFFEAAVRVIYEAFPKQINGRPLHDRWSECRALIQHGTSLAERFMEFQGQRTSKPLQTVPELGELLKNCAWYKYEIAEFDPALSILEIARVSCTDKKSTLYAHLLNTEMSIHYELNDLQKCRTCAETSLELRKGFAQSGDADAVEDYAVQLNNFGNLETAEGDIDAALISFGKAERLKIKLGVEAAVSLGLLHITTGRAHFLKGDFPEAESRYNKAEDIFVKKYGVRAHFMAHLKYARGNLEVKRKRPDLGKKYYEESQEILEAEESTKYHILRAANFYKIACLQIEEGKLENALGSLAQARHIAELRGAKGEAARIIRKQAYVYSLHDTEEARKEFKSHQQLAELMRARCPGKHASFLKFEDDDEEWNKLVCGYFR